MKDFLEKYSVGLTLDPNDPIQLADALIKLDSEPENLRKMGENASQVATKYFDKDYLANKMLKGITEACQ
jgi:glycosyltransferase involved in cell wall biosynthesis